MKKIIVLFLITPNLVWAAGLNWTAFDVKRCITWYFDVGVSEDYKEEYKKKYGKDVPKRQGKNGFWTGIVATTSKGRNQYALCYSSSDFSGKNRLVQCKGYGKGKFPLGSALFKTEKGKQTPWSGRYKCIRNCNSTRIRLFYDHGWESDLPDDPRYTATSKAMERCRKKKTN